MMILKQFFLKTMIRMFGAKGFSKMYLATSKCKTYSLFCNKVYGRDLCQANMLDEEQLQQLLLKLDLNSSHHILDIGCGIGKIGEYISDTTGASYTGVDFASGAIHEAQMRTLSKKEKINFRVGNLNSLETVIREKYEAIILIDSLYFVSDMPKCIETLKSFLKPHGKLIIFYSSTKKSSDKDFNLSPQNKPVGLALTKSGFKYEAFDFTANEEEIWRKSLITAEELKEKFSEEGNKEIYKSRIAEGKSNLKAHEKKLILRYLYYASFGT
jgi:2-polyprenyl-3-methyl-5-hydroxy-6-metoxy-1,4-benzoquinol methylase